MTDEQKKSLDLATAQQLYIAAGLPEQAAAAGFVIDAVRNTVQGEWGKSFVNSLEGLLTRHIAPLVKGQEETHSGIAALSTQFQTLAETVDGLQAAMRESREDRQAIHAELTEVKGQLATYIAGSKRGELVAINQRLTSLEDDKKRFEAVELALRELSARIGGALPTEADQELNAQFRDDASAAGG